VTAMAGAPDDTDPDAGSPDVVAPDTDLAWMQHALVLADRAELEDDEIPVGAVLVGADGGLLAEGWNRNISDNDPTAHAEIVAMRRAGARWSMPAWRDWCLPPATRRRAPAAAFSICSVTRGTTTGCRWIRGRSRTRRDVD